MIDPESKWRTQKGATDPQEAAEVRSAEILELRPKDIETLRALDEQTEVFIKKSHEGKTINTQCRVDLNVHAQIRRIVDKEFGSTYPDTAAFVYDSIIQNIKRIAWIEQDDKKRQELEDFVHSQRVKTARLLLDQEKETVASQRYIYDNFIAPGENVNEALSFLAVCERLQSNLRSSANRTALGKIMADLKDKFRIGEEGA